MFLKNFTIFVTAISITLFSAANAVAADDETEHIWVTPEYMSFDQQVERIRGCTPKINGKSVAIQDFLAEVERVGRETDERITKNSGGGLASFVYASGKQQALAEELDWPRQCTRILGTSRNGTMFGVTLESRDYIVLNSGTIIPRNDYESLSEYSIVEQVVNGKGWKVLN